MAFRSHAQREKMQELVKLGRLSQAQYDEMEKGTPRDLPDRVHPKKDPSGK